MGKSGFVFLCPQCGVALSDATMQTISRPYRPERPRCENCNSYVAWLRWPERFLAIGMPFGMLSFILAIVLAPRGSGAGSRPGFWLTLAVYGPLLFALICLLIKVRYGRLIAEPMLEDDGIG